jgi:hypothetical protein
VKSFLARSRAVGFFEHSLSFLKFVSVYGSFSVVGFAFLNLYWSSFADGRICYTVQRKLKIRTFP